ncbi:MAG: transglycosylase SLT domain-containing protein [Gammaproteobacteria bacterium]
MKTILITIFVTCVLGGCSQANTQGKYQESTCIELVQKIISFSRLTNFEKEKFFELKESRLGNYQRIFQEAASLNGLDWELVAAVAFQESQWNPKARSNTQVKGMMMLTLPTAKSLGVMNRLDAKQSILGGSKYLADLKEQIEFGTSSGDKIAFLLAAYNLGLGNIKTLVYSINKNMNEVTWLDLEDILLNDVDQNSLPGNTHDYSRGQQTVDFVERVRDYYYLLLTASCD